MQHLNEYADRGVQPKVRELAGKTEASFADFASAFYHAPMPQVCIVLQVSPLAFLAHASFLCGCYRFMRSKLEIDRAVALLLMRIRYVAFVPHPQQSPCFTIPAMKSF
jgi:hypothetical protein